MKTSLKKYRIYYYEDLIGDHFSNILAYDFEIYDDISAMKYSESWCKENKFKIKEVHRIINTYL